MDIHSTSFYFMLLLGSAWFVFFGVFGLVGIYDKEKRPTTISFGLALVGLILCLSLSSLDLTGRIIALSIIVVALLLLIGIFLLPIGRLTLGSDIPTAQFDERDTMFARRILQPDSPDYLSYYERRPEYKKLDDIFRS